jgi:hypothetical protein
MNPDRTLFSIEIAETRRDRAYWTFKPWVADELRDAIGSADVLVLPWEDFRQDKPALFPEGAADFVRGVRADLTSVKLELAIDKDKYEEIALYANEWRLPTLLCTSIILPILTGVVANHVDRWVSGTPEAIIELEVIIQKENHKCFSVKYKGPSTRIAETITDQMKACFDKHPPSKQSRSGR